MNSGSLDAGVHEGCTGTDGCNDDNVGEVRCACNGAGGCIDTCSNNICQSWEDIDTCSYDCNQPPEITDVRLSHQLINPGNELTFTADWSDPNPGTGATVHICKTSQISGKTCQEAFCETTALSLSSPLECSYTTQESDSYNNDYYAFVCDSYPYSSCSAAYQGQFKVNQPPSIVSASSNADSLFGKLPGENVVFNVEFADGPGETARIHICKTDSFSDCNSDNWCQESVFGDSPRSCSYIVQEVGYQTNPYYVFVEDNGGLVSGPIPKDFYEDREYRISKFTIRDVYISKNSLIDVPVKVMNRQIDETAEIILNLDGIGEFRLGRTKTPVVIENNGKTARFTGVEPMTVDMVLVSLPSLSPQESQPYKITLLKSESSVEPFPETDILEITPYFEPAFPTMSWESIGILFCFSVLAFHASKRR
ncbi:MAG: hypothetical protein ABIH90_01120 [Candidatus Aenigmatarchaeota archaeon]